MFMNKTLGALYMKGNAWLGGSNFMTNHKNCAITKHPGTYSSWNQTIGS